MRILKSATDLFLVTQWILDHIKQEQSSSYYTIQVTPPLSIK